ncbi:MAG: hypothetical protein R2758_03305 [Bacteroidales bacterium]
MASRSRKPGQWIKTEVPDEDSDHRKTNQGLPPSSRRAGGKEYETIVAYDGITGEKVALGETVDLVILDLIIPGKDGIEGVQIDQGSQA